MSNLHGDRLIYFTAGVSLVLMMYSVVRHATELFASEAPETRNILGMVEDRMWRVGLKWAGQASITTGL